MRRKPAVILAAAVAAQLGLYRSPADYAGSGDFEFRYPGQLVVLQDYVYTDASLPQPRHTVVLRQRDAETGDLRSIEINALRSLNQRYTCEDYSVCRVVDGVIIGTNSQDPEFRKAFDVVAGSFHRKG